MLLVLAQRGIKRRNRGMHLLHLGKVHFHHVLVVGHAVREGARLVVPFTVESTPEKGAKIFCKGQLSFAVMDLTTMKPQALPDWVRPYFFQ